MAELLNGTVDSVNKRNKENGDILSKQEAMLISELERQISSMKLTMEYEKKLEQQKIADMKKKLKQKTEELHEKEAKLHEAEGELKQTIILLEDANKEYVMVTQQRANELEIDLKAELDVLQSKLAESIAQNEQLKESVCLNVQQTGIYDTRRLILPNNNTEDTSDFKVQYKTNDNIAWGRFVDSMCCIPSVSCLDKPNKIVFSDEIIFLGKWRLIMYRTSSGNLNIIVVMLKGISGMYHFRIELVHSTYPKSIKVEETEYLRMMWPSNSKYFMNYEKFYQDKYYDEPTDSVRLKFSVRQIQGDPLNDFGLVERFSSHRIEIKNFNQLINQNVINYCTFYDDLGYSWKLVLKRFTDGDNTKKLSSVSSVSSVSVLIYLLNGMFDEDYSVEINLLNQDPANNVSKRSNQIFKSSSDSLMLENYITIEKLVNGGFLNSDETLEIDVKVQLLNSQFKQKNFTEQWAQCVVRNHFKSSVFKVLLSDRLKSMHELSDEMGNAWHVTIIAHDVWIDESLFPVKYIKFLLQLSHGVDGIYEFLVELLHQKACKVITRPVKGAFNTEERYEISQFASFDRLRNEGYVAGDRSLFFRLAVRPINTEQQ